MEEAKGTEKEEAEGAGWDEEVGRKEGEGQAEEGDRN